MLVSIANAAVYITAKTIIQSIYSTIQRLFIRTVQFLLQARGVATLIARNGTATPVAKNVTVVNVVAPLGTSQNVIAGEDINTGAGPSAKPGTAMGLAKASDPIEVALPGIGCFAANVIVSVRLAALRTVV